MRGRRILSIIVLALMLLSLFLFILEEVEAQTVDYIQIRDAPGGLGNIVTTGTYSVWETDEFYAAGYNLTEGYIGDVSVEWLSDHPTVGNVTSPGIWTNFTAQWVDVNSTCTVTATYNAMISNSTGLLTVLAPTTDYVQIRTALGGGGINLCDPANYPSYPMGHITTFYGAAYNSTAGYIGDVNLSSTWESNDTSIVTVTSPGSSSTIVCSDTNSGWVWVTLEDNGGRTNTTKVTVLGLTVDYILITDSPGGEELGTVILNMGEQVTAYASGYDSTDTFVELVDVNWSQNPVLGALNPTYGNSTTFTAWSPGMTTIMGKNFTTDLYDWFNVKIPSVDYIVITDAPNGSELTTVVLDIGGNVTAYASGYNYSSGYAGLVLVDWSQSPVLGWFDNWTGTSTTFTAGYAGGSTTITGWDEKSGLNDTFIVTINPPTVDFIRLTYSPNGNEIPDLSWYIGDPLLIYASGYNNTGPNDTYTYAGLVEVLWSDTPDLGDFDNSVGTYSNFTGTSEGTTTIQGVNWTLDVNDTFWLNLQPPPDTVDYINITDSPNGSELTTVVLNVGEQVTAYASGYNYTSGYVDLVVVDWSQWPSLGSFDNLTGTSTTFTAGGEGGSTTITGQDTDPWLNDTFNITINPPTLDFILLTDSPNGNEIGDISWYIGDPLLIYASGYNDTVLGNMTSIYMELVEVSWTDTPDLGDFDNLTGNSSTFTGTSEGLTTIKGDNGTLNDTFQLTLLPPPDSVDYINITDAPNGSELTTVVLNVTEQVTAYASGYNNTSGYVGLVIVDWSQSPSLGSFDNLTGTSTTFTAGYEDGTTTITGQEPTSGMNDSFDVIINPPEADFILLTDSPNGVEIDDMSWYVGDPLLIYASGYNTTIGNGSPVYIGLVNVTWTDSPDLGDFDNPIGTSSTFTGTSEGQTTIKGENGILNDTFQLTLITSSAELEYIIITESPNGIPLDNMTLPVGGQITAYASGYDATGYYIGLVEVNWSQSPALGSFDNLTGNSTTFTAGYSAGSTTIMGENLTLGVNDTFDVIILQPCIDYIIITDMPNGTELINVSLFPGEQITAYASGYNTTSGFVDLVNVSWSQIPVLGSFDNLTGTSTTFTAGVTGGLTIVKGESVTLGCNDTFDINITTATVDYIQIRDAPSGGGSVVWSLTLDVGQSFTLWAAAYNFSSGYLGDFASTTWNETSGGSVITVTTPGASTSVQAQLIGGTSTVNADFNGTQNTTSVTVNPPTVDYIQIRTQPDGGGIDLGDPANYKSYPVGTSDTYYGAMYNYTAGYFADVPSTATWVSSNTSIVTVTSPGSPSNITCDDQNWGTVTITLSTSGKQNTTQVTVLEPAVDYVQIRDQPNGSGNIVTDRTYIVWQTDEFYAAGYNITAGYLGELEATWWSNDTTVGKVTSPGYWTTFTAQKIDKDSICHVTTEYNGIYNSTGDLTVLAPTIDYIVIVDSPNGNGSWVADRTYNEGDNDTFWAAGYNLTADYVKDVKTTWESDNPIVGNVSYGPNEYTNFSAGWKGGYCCVTATYDALTNRTGPLFVINVNQLPTAIAKYHNGTGFQGGDFSFSIDITLRVTGRKQNVITMELEEDGIVVNGITVTRHSNLPDIGMISYEMDANCVYEIVLSYDGNNGGSNPVIVTFEFLGNIYSVHLLFNSQHGIEQKARIDFNDICKLVGVVFFDGFFSSDFDGYLTEYEWDFGDGSTEAGETLAHTYEENGNYSVILTIMDDEGGEDTSTITVTVKDIDNNDQANAIPGQQEGKGYLNASGQYVVILQCPADLLITNLEGGRIGLLNKSQINNIVGAFAAMLFSDVEVYYIPMGETYTLEVFGTGEGFYDLSVIGVENDIIKKYCVTDVRCSESTLDTYIFDFEEESISLSTNEDDKRYSMHFHTSVEENWDDFYLTDMGLNNNETHIYKVNNWEGLGSSKSVTLSIDEESDGLIDRSVALETGLTGDDVDALLLKSPVIEPIFPFLLFFIIGSILAISIGSFLTEVGKWALLMLFLPLYSRIKKEELLNQPTRYKIHGYLIGNPGAHFGLIKQDLNMPNGQLAYHLRQMMGANIIYSKEDGIRKRFYPKDFPKSKGSEHYFSDTQEKILGVIKMKSGISQKKIAASIGISRQVAGYHLTKMEEIGLIKKERVGRESKYYPHEKYSV